MDYNYLIWTMVQSHKTGSPLGMNTHLGIVNLLRRNRKSTSGDAVAKIVLVPERASNISVRRISSGAISRVKRFCGGCDGIANMASATAISGEWGVSVDHSTIYRGVQKYAPEIDKRLRCHWRRLRSTSWYVDETGLRACAMSRWLFSERTRPR